MPPLRRFFALFALLACGLNLPARAQPDEALRPAQILVAEGSYAAAALRLEAVAPEALTPGGAYLLGRCYQALLQNERAVAAFRHADTSSAAVLADLGYSLERLGLPDEAEAHYRAAYRFALGLAPRRAEFLFHLAALYDVYYADKHMALEQYERFLSEVEAGQWPQMASYAQRRVQEIREKKFFDQGRTPPPASLDTVVIQPSDTSGMREQ